ncbi:MAG: hypothetical protein ACLTSL_01310 [Odoribacter splanchnicus]
MKYKVIFACFLGILSFSCRVEHTLEWDGKYADEFLQGSGGADDPWLISSTQELAWLARSVNRGNSYQGQYFKLTADLDMQGENEKCRWPGIGGVTLFRGIFNGDGHRIRNICIDGLKTVAPCGLFGKVGEGGLIQSLFVEKVWCSGKTDYYTGAMAGMNDGVISECVAKEVAGMSGGVIGCNNGTILRCYATGEIKGAHGGIAGYNYGRVKYCLSQARVTNHAGFLAMNVGGICGINYGGISGCAFTGTVYGEKFIGGIAGDMKREGYIENCYNRGKVKSETYGSGGIVGYTAGGKIRNCYNAGSGGAPILSSPYPFENSYYDTKTYRDPYYCPPEGKTTRFMKSTAFVKVLNERKADGLWLEDTKGVNDGYPVIKGIDYMEKLD